MRLDFLRQYSVDPIDLSPLVRGDRISFGALGMVRLSLDLPFFRDYGTATESMQINGIYANTLGVKDAYKKWCLFRQSVAATALDIIMHAARSAAPNLPILARHEVDASGNIGAYFADSELPSASAIPGAAASPQAAPRHIHNGPKYSVQGEPIESYVRIGSKEVYYTVDLPANAPTAAVAKSELTRRVAIFLDAPGSWDGVVVDLSTESVPEILGVLADFTSIPVVQSSGGRH